MALISKTFDAKINVIFPHISRSIPSKDSDRIRATNFFRYESQKTVQTQGGSVAAIEEVELTNSSRLDIIDSELKELKKDFKKIEEHADKAFEGLVYTYNVQDESNEHIENAERNIFGDATGLITFSKYKQAKELLEAVDEIIRERMVRDGGEFNVG
jgi:hypothetical protein